MIDIQVSEATQAEVDKISADILAFAAKLPKVTSAAEVDNNMEVDSTGEGDGE